MIVAWLLRSELGRVQRVRWRREGSVGRDDGQGRRGKKGAFFWKKIRSSSGDNRIEIKVPTAGVARGTQLETHPTDWSVSG